MASSPIFSRGKGAPEIISGAPFLGTICKHPFPPLSLSLSKAARNGRSRRAIRLGGRWRVAFDKLRLSGIVFASLFRSGGTLFRGLEQRRGRPAEQRQDFLAHAIGFFQMRRAGKDKAVGAARDQLV